MAERGPGEDGVSDRGNTPKHQWGYVHVIARSWRWGTVGGAEVNHPEHTLPDRLHVIVNAGGGRVI